MSGENNAAEYERYASRARRLRDRAQEGYGAVADMRPDHAATLATTHAALAQAAATMHLADVIAERFPLEPTHSP